MSSLRTVLLPEEDQVASHPHGVDGTQDQSNSVEADSVTPEPSHSDPQLHRVLRMMEFVPGRWNFKQRINTKIEDECQRYSQLFDELALFRDLAATDKQAIALRFENHVLRLSISTVPVREMTAVVFSLFAVGLLIAATIVFDSVERLHFLAFREELSNAGIAAFFVAVLVGVTVSKVYLPLHRRFGDTRGSFLKYVVPALLIVGGISSVGSILPSLSVWEILGFIRDGLQLLLVFVMFGLGFGAVMGGLVLVVVAMIDSAEQRVRRRHPDAVVTTKLVTILSDIERNPGSWDDLNFKRRLVSHLEDIAAAIERDLPHSLHSNEPATDSWFQAETAKMAAAVREKKKWVLMPKSDTLSEITASLRHTFLQVIQGDWDAVERGTVEHVPFPTRWYARIAGFLRVAVVAGTPAIAFWGFQFTSLRLTDSSADYVTIGVFVWAVLSVMWLVDPHVGDKVSTARDLIPFLPSRGSGNQS